MECCGYTAHVSNVHPQGMLEAFQAKLAELRKKKAAEGAADEEDKEKDAESPNK